MARKQSWNQEDWKHDLQMGQMRKSTGSQPGVEERGTVLGFTEVGGDNVRFSQS